MYAAPQSLEVYEKRERISMGIIKAVNLIFDYIRHDEEEDKDEVSHALKGARSLPNKTFFPASVIFR